MTERQKDFLRNPQLWEALIELSEEVPEGTRVSIEEEGVFLTLTLIKSCDKVEI